MRNTLRFVPRYAVLAMVLAFVVSCDDDTPTLPTPTPPTLVTDTFSGSIGRNGANSHNFTALSAGTITSTLTAVGPDAVGADGTALVVGFGVGTWSGNACTILQSQDRAVQSAVLYSNVNVRGDLCVRVFDVGNVTDAVDYTVTIVHP